MRAAFRIVLLATTGACGKVPIVPVNAGFSLADVAWFGAEETLFVFYELSAEQGLGPDSTVELTYTTDDIYQPWAEIAGLSMVHTHVPIDCGRNTLCGSASVRVASEPRNVGVQLRYHRDGNVTLPAEVTFNAIAAGPAYSNRSFLVYGVFDEVNSYVQWRGRHTFPTLHNEEAQALGLRRYFQIAAATYGTPDDGTLSGDGVFGNPYGYAYAPVCPSGFASIGASEALETTDRAVWSSVDLPVAAGDASLVCAQATVTDATGTLTSTAIARKNPQVRPAFPTLRSPIRTATPVRLFLAPCERTISAEHAAMQKQRLGIDGATDLCIDDWQDEGFADELAALIQARIDTTRAAGNDMVLVLGLHHDTTSDILADRVEDALAAVLPFENNKSSPRVAGAFVFDSAAHDVERSDLERLVLWCPADLFQEDLDEIPDIAQRECPVLPDIPTLQLGPFRFSTLPILPTRTQYVNFINKYSVDEAGSMKSLTFRVPERTPVSENIPADDYGEITFFNDEILTAAAGDVFSYCGFYEWAIVVFRSAAEPTPQPLVVLPETHAAAPEATYGLGLYWDFPFLLRLEYEVVLAGAATAFFLTVPFGIDGTTDAYYGTTLWETGEFSLSESLLQCTRFCDHPTFDSAGVYNVGSAFQDTYRNTCYRPRYPTVSDGGFPLDP